jgi:hypothetical protein
MNPLVPVTILPVELINPTVLMFPPVTLPVELIIPAVRMLPPVMLAVAVTVVALIAAVVEVVSAQTPNVEFQVYTMPFCVVV